MRILLQPLEREHVTHSSGICRKSMTPLVHHDFSYIPTLVKTKIYLFYKYHYRSGIQNSEVPNSLRHVALDGV